MTYSAGWPTKLANKSHGGIYGGWGRNAFRNDTAQCVPQAEFWRTLKSPVFNQECCPTEATILSHLRPPLLFYFCLHGSNKSISYGGLDILNSFCGGFDFRSRFKHIILLRRRRTKPSANPHVSNHKKTLVRILGGEGGNLWGDGGGITPLPESVPAGGRTETFCFAAQKRSDGRAG